MMKYKKYSCIDFLALTKEEGAALFHKIRHDIWVLEVTLAKYQEIITTPSDEPENLLYGKLEKLNRDVGLLRDIVQDHLLAHCIS
jgi:hypothetical protein